MGEGNCIESGTEGVFNQGKENTVRARRPYTVGYAAASEAQHLQLVGAAPKTNDPIVGLESLR